MAVAVKKYNPGFLTDDEIVASFCVRTAEFDSLVESLHESDASSSPHSLVIGPRGSGKTHLLLRVAAEVRRNPAFAGLFPVVFAEESYEVATCGEFWLECLGRLAEQAPDEEHDNLRLTYDELRTVTDDQALADRCIGSLLDFADRHETRLLLLVENLNMLFTDIDDPEVGWRLRQTLQTEARFTLFGSATSRFDEIDNPEHALYDLFRVVMLHPLNTAECEILWGAVAGKPSTRPSSPADRDSHRRQPTPPHHHCPLRRPTLLPRPHGEPPRPRRRAHRVLQEPPRITATPGTPRLPRPRPPMEAFHHPRSRSPTLVSTSTPAVPNSNDSSNAELSPSKEARPAAVSTTSPSASTTSITYCEGASDQIA